MPFFSERPSNFAGGPRRKRAGKNIANFSVQFALREQSGKDM
jgi:hypothetical protein